MAKSLAERLLPKPFLDQLERILNVHNGYSNRAASNRRGPGGKSKKQASSGTQYFRRLNLRLSFAQLWELGYQLRAPENIGARHIEVLVQHWAEQGISAATMQTRIAFLNVFSQWIGKQGIVKSPDAYFPDGEAKRTTIAQSDKSWEAMSIDIERKIGEAMKLNERFGVMLNLQYRFGLRMKESIEIHPARVLVDDGSAIEIFEGTKGGRPRRIDIERPEQLDALNQARRLALEGKTGRLRWPGLTWRQARNRFYHYMRRLGLTKGGLGVTAHGLRHGYAQDGYQVLTGRPSPIKGGALGSIDRATHDAACFAVSRKLGHGRKQVTASYYGSYGHQLRGTISNEQVQYTVTINNGGQNGIARFGV